jgi:hypothetical protein
MVVAVSASMTGLKRATAQLGGGPACVCETAAEAEGHVQVFNRWCSPTAFAVQFQEWRVATGTPILVRECADWDDDLSWVLQPDDSQTAPITAGVWAPHAHFGSDVPGASFVARKSTLTNPGSNTPYWDPRVQFGLDDAALSAGDRPSTHLDFALPLRALWIEVNETPGPPGSPATRCGIRFQHRVSVGGATAYVTIAALPWDAEWGGVVVDPRAPGADELTIDRVVFDPPEGPGEDRRATRVVRIAWQTMLAAKAQGEFPRPDRMDVVGPLAGPWSPGTLVPENGASVLRAYWPVSSAHPRMNAHGVIAGSFSVLDEQSETARGIRPAIWCRNAQGAWARHDLELPMIGGAHDLTQDLVACALTDVYTDGNGQRVIMVGGWKTASCPVGSPPPPSCGKPHARAWRVVVDAGQFDASGVVVPVSAAPVAVVGPDGGVCDGSAVDESQILDLKVVPGPVPGQSFAVGCGPVGMGCARPDGLPGANTKAAVFVFTADGAGGSVAYARPMDPNDPFHCLPGGEGPPHDLKWTQSHANAFVRGEPLPWDHGVVGWFSPHARCSFGLDIWCDLFSSASEWGWNSWGWALNPMPAQATQSVLNGYPLRRMAPHLSGTPDEFEGLRQNFASLAASVSQITLEGASAGITSSVGWMVDSCTNPQQCPCYQRAALFEYRSEMGEGCWDVLQGGGAPVAGQPGPGCQRILDLHAAMWVPDAGGEAWSTPQSCASAVASTVSATGELRRIVLGARFDFNAASAFDAGKARSMIWFGRSPCLSSSPQTCEQAVVPESAWCGLPVQEIVSTVRLEDGTVRSWQELLDAPSTFLAMGYDINGAASVLVAGRLGLGAPYILARLHSRADFNGDERVDGADIGALMAAWGGATPAYPALGLHDLNDDGEITGADLGLLLASWGTGGPWVECGGAALSSLEIEVISLATIELGLADMDALMAWMDTMTPEQRAYVALYLMMRAAAIAAEEER